MLYIEGLTQYQLEMLEHMWSLKTNEEFEDWLSLLCEEDYIMAKGLAQLVAYECLDEICARKHYNSYKEAKEVLFSVM